MSAAGCRRARGLRAVVRAGRGSDARAARLTRGLRRLRPCLGSLRAETPSEGEASLVAVAQQDLVFQAYRGETPPRFAHRVELECAQILDYYGVAWLYEPTAFVLARDEQGRVTEAFAPDFYLPDQDLYVEITVMKQSLVTRKHRKLRKLRALHPEVRVKLLYRRDIERLAERLGLRLASCGRRTPSCAGRTSSAGSTSSPGRSRRTTAAGGSCCSPRSAPSSSSTTSATRCRSRTSGTSSSGSPTARARPRACRASRCARRAVRTSCSSTTSSTPGSAWASCAGRSRRGAAARLQRSPVATVRTGGCSTTCRSATSASWCRTRSSPATGSLTSRRFASRRICMHSAQKFRHG